MLPGPTITRQCSACGQRFAEQTIASGNTFGARFWTDGKRDAPMLPDSPWLVKCRHCCSLVWIDEQIQIEEIEPWGSSDRFPDVLPPSTPTLEDYANFLSTGVNEKEKERYVRLRAWWTGNDPRRSSGQSTPLNSFETENLRSFVTLLDEAEENNRIMKAEAFRELGEFADAEKLLATNFADELIQSVSLIRDFTQNEITTVEEMRFE